MRESRLYGSVRGALSNERPYRERFARSDDGGASRHPFHPPDLVLEEPVTERGERGPFLVVLAIAVTARRGLVEIRFISHRLQLGGHLARVSGVDAVVASRGGNQHRRIFLLGLCGVIGGIGLQP